MSYKRAIDRNQPIQAYHQLSELCRQADVGEGLFPIQMLPLIELDQKRSPDIQPDTLIIPQPQSPHLNGCICRSKLKTKKFDIGDRNFAKPWVFDGVRQLIASKQLA
jgi:hypothetical protein